MLRWRSLQPLHYRNQRCQHSRLPKHPLPKNSKTHTGNGHRTTTTTTTIRTETNEKEKASRHLHRSPRVAASAKLSKKMHLPNTSVQNAVLPTAVWRVAASTKKSARETRSQTVHLRPRIVPAVPQQHHQPKDKRQQNHWQQLTQNRRSTAAMATIRPWKTGGKSRTT